MGQASSFYLCHFVQISGFLCCLLAVTTTLSITYNWFVDWTLVKVFCEVRYGLYFVASSTESIAVMWLVWARFQRLNEALR